MSDDTTTITLNQSGADTIRDMQRQAAAIDEAWRSINPAYAKKATASLARQVTELFSSFFGQHTKIFRDGDLSLYVVTDSIVFGVIYHRAHRDTKEPVAGDPDMSYGAPMSARYCMATVGGGNRYCATPFTYKGDDEQGTRTCTDPHDVFPVTMPVPGDWSFHS